MKNYLFFIIGQGQGIAFNSRMIKDFPGFKFPLDAAEIDWDQFYQILAIEPSMLFVLFCVLYGKRHNVFVLSMDCVF